MIKNGLILLSLICVFFSCKKDTLVMAPPSSLSNTVTATDTMLPLSVGNYWIYQKSNDDTLGNLNLQNSFDSVYVEKDTFIVGEHYYKLGHSNSNFYNYYFLPNFNGAVYIKDSANYLITSEHLVLLDKVHIHDTIRKDVFSVNEYACTVPDNFTQKQFVMGNHSGLSMNIIYIRNHPQSMVKDTACSQMFVDKIGIVKSIYSFSGCLKHCRYSQNLIRYHLN
ncbi:MAG: hypothetical protein V4580_07270 [Bacteroidota bacterium]